MVSTPYCGCRNPSSILGLDTMLRKSKRGACRQKAATVLPNRTAAAKGIYSDLSSFEFDIVGYGAPHDA